jgi:hypothetical protein
MKLNQIVAVEKGVKSRAEKDLTETHHALKKGDLVNGLSRVYRPKNEDGEALPPENKKVQALVEDAIKRTGDILVELFDVTATKDFGNCHATADVIVDGKVLVKAAPVTYLLWLEKRLVLLHEFVKELPRLNDADTWVHDPALGVWVTPEEITHRTKKVPVAFRKAEATEKHPAQVDVVHEDQVVGFWHLIKRSGAVPADRVRQLVDRVEKMQRAVKMAREEANMADVEKKAIGRGIMDYLFAA